MEHWELGVGTSDHPVNYSRKVRKELLKPNQLWAMNKCEPAGAFVGQRKSRDEPLP